MINDATILIFEFLEGKPNELAPKAFSDVVAKLEKLFEDACSPFGLVSARLVLVGSPALGSIKFPVKPHFTTNAERLETKNLRTRAARDRLLTYGKDGILLSTFLWLVVFGKTGLVDMFGKPSRADPSSDPAHKEFVAVGLENPYLSRSMTQLQLSIEKTGATRVWIEVPDGGGAVLLFESPDAPPSLLQIPDVPSGMIPAGECNLERVGDLSVQVFYDGQPREIVLAKIVTPRGPSPKRPQIEPSHAGPEPTMEEILASIRKIIGEDSEAGASPVHASRLAMQDGKELEELLQSAKKSVNENAKKAPSQPKTETPYESGALANKVVAIILPRKFKPTPGMKLRSHLGAVDRERLVFEASPSRVFRDAVALLEVRAKR